MDKDEYNYLIKFIVIGNSGTGKSCLLHYFLENKFKKNSTHTIGVEFGSSILKFGSKSLKLQIWDTAGQERYRSVSRTYYRGALGAIVCFDITDQDSFNSVAQWIKDARDLGRPDISIIVIGNKLDLKDKRSVSFKEAAKLCQENSVGFVETSALTGENIMEAFTVLSKNILLKIESGLIDINDIKPKRSSSKYLNNAKKSKDHQFCLGCS